jgi:hypothetical protein
MGKEVQYKRFAELWRGIFFLVSSVSLCIVLFMFIFVWQPIWTKGFSDFHTISEAISKLDQTAKPASKVAPLMLVEISKMNQTMTNMDTTMLRVNTTMEQMSQSMSGQMGRMNYEVDRMGDKLSPFGMMPFNW